MRTPAAWRLGRYACKRSRALPRGSIKDSPHPLRPSNTRTRSCRRLRFRAHRPRAPRSLAYEPRSGWSASFQRSRSYVEEDGHPCVQPSTVLMSNGPGTSLLSRSVRVLLWAVDAKASAATTPTSTSPVTRVPLPAISIGTWCRKLRRGSHLFKRHEARRGTARTRRQKRQDPVRS